MPNNNEIYNTIPSHLVGHGFDLPDSPSIGKIQEDALSLELEEARKLALDENNQFLQGPKHAQNVANYINIRDAFIKKFIFIPTKHAREHMRQCQKGMGFDDIFSVACQALIQAVDNHDFRKNTRFYSYAVKAVRNAIERFLDENGRSIRVPTHVISSVFVKVKDTTLQKNPKLRKLLADLGLGSKDLIGKSLKEFAKKHCCIEQVAEAVNLDLDTMISIVEPTVSIDSNEDEETGIEQFLKNDKYVGNHHKHNMILAAIAKAHSGTSYFAEFRNAIHRIKMFHSQVEKNLNWTIDLTDYLKKASTKIIERIADKSGDLTFNVKRTIETDRMLMIVRDYYIGGMSHNEISNKYGFTKQRAKQMIDKGLKTLQTHKSARKYLNAALYNVSPFDAWWKMWVEKGNGENKIEGKQKRRIRPE
jgi:RNA polymerase sigma factor (sigma-70 family)